MTEGPFRAPIGEDVRSPRAPRLLAGRGKYTDDISAARIAHVAYLRSPYAHARIVAIDRDAATSAPGVLLVATGAEISDDCASWRGTHDLFPGLVAVEQPPLAINRVYWHGEPVVAVVAETRAEAEDAVELIEVQWEEFPPVADAATALSGPAIHPELGGNIGFETTVEAGDASAAFAAAHLVVEERFRFGRHTGVSLEPRTILADYNPAEDSLLVHQSHQTPHQQQDLFSRLLGIPEHKVRVVCPDVGGAFGLKHHLHGDEITACVLSRKLGRPVKFVADRLESFLSDIHCRDHEITARMALNDEGQITAMEVDDLFLVGPYSQYPRSSIAEGNQISRLCGAPYRHADYRAHLRMLYQNKNLIGHIRSVGHPLAAAVTEGLLDKAAVSLAIDPVELRRRNYLRDEDFPLTSPGGVDFEHLSFNACLERILEMMDRPALLAEQNRLREKGVYRGIGLTTFVELTAIGPEYYGGGGQHISAQEGCFVRIEPSGMIRCMTGVTDQGQGIDAGIQQIVASVLGVPVDDVRVESGDSELSPYGGGSWGSRGAVLGGETALRAARALRRNILDLAATLLQCDASTLDIRVRNIVDATSGQIRMSLAEIANTGHFKPFAFPKDMQPALAVVEHYASRDRLFVAGNGIQASYLEVDPETGFVKLLGHWVVHDAGRLLNPLMVKEQIRGGVVQGLGGVLFEECIYSAQGQLQNGTFADYLVPMAAEMPDIEVDHIETPTATSELGTKGAGEAGTAGAIGAVLGAINDALSPFDARISETPCTPDRILRALGKI
ncbi:MAG: xanthine dehydrogenase family protein molybdopterin-binding subunit [Alphaproteobacteria bacterium]